MTGCWRGAEYLVGGDGYRIVLESLEHYARRLRGMGDNPELGGAGMFAMVIRQAATQRLPAVHQALDGLRRFLVGGETAVSLAGSLPAMTSALECYEADIQRALDGSDYYKRMLGPLMPSADSKLAAIREAKSLIGRFE